MPGRKPGTPKTGGRKAGTPNKVGADVRALAREYTEQSITTLALALTKAPEWSARVNAAKILLERGWGAPKVDVAVKQAVYVIGDHPLSADEWAAGYADESPRVEPAGRTTGSPRKVPAARGVLRGSKRGRKD